jgi:hypothetical protein
MAKTILSRVPMKNSQLRDLHLRLCSLHELAADPSLGYHCSGGRGFGVAEFRQESRRLRLQMRLRPRAGSGVQKGGRRALNLAKKLEK